jgi:GntR family transcriptional regulator
MTTDKPSFQPLYQQIRTLLAQRIAQGEWAAHEALPSEWALAESLGVSQGTVRKALTDLVDEGWLYRQQGKGTFVAPGLNEWGDGHLVTPGQFAEPPGSPVPELLSCTQPSSTKSVSALRTVPWLTPSDSASAHSLGKASCAAHSPCAMRCASSVRICWYSG